MIVRDRPHGAQLLYIVRGSVLPHIAWELATCTAVALLVTLTHGFVYEWKITLTTVPFSLIGLALAIFLGFRNNAAYDRYWEGRKLWAELVARSRTFARQVQTLAHFEAPAGPADRDDPRHGLVMRTIAFASALRHQLRRTDPLPDVRRLLAPADVAGFAAARSGTDFLLRRNGEALGALLRERRLDAPVVADMDQSLSALTAVAAGCERIQNTPLPFPYTLLLHRTAWLYCFLLPFGLVDTVGFMTPFVVAIVAYTFFGLDALGDEIEEPFGLAENHLPLDALCREVEIHLLEALGERDLPPPLTPQGWQLT
ncbi:MAG TPA: bestrophin family ion channel [Ramlibacter sp.]|uniref:bestrophin family protein n=1 Tax=Ramlibacter sp. TaxID=1917967 RepID=UPI002D6362CA|nr:bestrophin family ion channel [Ramlibacter sp.]HZY16877.1 bestrophin family ion channel [Ramlibacter sp.]